MQNPHYLLQAHKQNKMKVKKKQIGQHIPIFIKLILLLIQMMKPTEKSDSRKKQKPTLSKATSATNLFKKQPTKKNNSAKKQDSVPSLKKNQHKSSTPLLHNPKPNLMTSPKNNPNKPNLSANNQQNQAIISSTKGVSPSSSKGTTSTPHLYHSKPTNMKTTNTKPNLSGNTARLPATATNTKGVSPSSSKGGSSSNPKSQPVSNQKGIGTSSIGSRATKILPPSLRTSPKSSISEINPTNLKKTSLENRKTKFQKPNLFVKKPVNPTPQMSSVKGQKQTKQQVKQSLANVIKVYHDPKKPQLDISLNQQSQVINSNSTTKPTTTINPQEKLCRAHFTFQAVIGEGGYGKVWKVEHNKSRATLAMKEMSKAMVILKKSVENVNNELKILSKIKSVWISNIICAFNDRDNLYLGMDYLPGGDLRTFLSDSERLKEADVKFLIACIIKAIEYIHSVKIFHRDIKPENLVIDEKGYLRLTDFGIARSAKDKQTLDASGTPGYMAPEVISKQAHSYSVDFYAVGIICYELMMGKRPYYGQNRAEVRDNILSKQHCIKKKESPPGWSNQSIDFINKLIQRQPNSRLGHKHGIKQLMEHPWLAKYQWKQLAQKKISSPFKPKYTVPAITDRMQEYDEAVNQYKLLQRSDNKVDIFSNYFFNFKDSSPPATNSIKKQIISK